MPAPALGLSTGEAHIHVPPIEPQLVDGEALADRVHFAEALQLCFQRLGWEAVHFQIEIFPRQAEQPIAHTAADKERASSRVSNGAAERQDLIGDVEGRHPLPPLLCDRTAHPTSDASRRNCSAK